MVTESLVTKVQSFKKKTKLRSALGNFLQMTFPGLYFPGLIPHKSSARSTASPTTHFKWWNRVNVPSPELPSVFRIGKKNLGKRLVSRCFVGDWVRRWAVGDSP